MRKVTLSLARRRDGSYAVIFAITLVVLLGFAAITIDVGYQRVVRNQLENITDASAHAGAHSLDGTNVGATAPRSWSALRIPRPASPSSAPRAEPGPLV